MSNIPEYLRIFAEETQAEITEVSGDGSRVIKVVIIIVVISVIAVLCLFAGIGG